VYSERVARTLSYNNVIGTLFALLILHNVKLSARKAESVLFIPLFAFQNDPKIKNVSHI